MPALPTAASTSASTRTERTSVRAAATPHMIALGLLTTRRAVDADGR